MVTRQYERERGAMDPVYREHILELRRAHDRRRDRYRKRNPEYWARKRNRAQERKRLRYGSDPIYRNRRSEYQRDRYRHKHALEIVERERKRNAREAARLEAKLQRQAKRALLAALTPEQRAARQREYQNKWRQDNPERIRQHNYKWNLRPDVREKKRARDRITRHKYTALIRAIKDELTSIPEIPRIWPSHLIRRRCLHCYQEQPELRCEGLRSEKRRYPAKKRHRQLSKEYRLRQAKRKRQQRKENAAFVEALRELGWIKGLDLVPL
jgi:hypothetical protein